MIAETIGCGFREIDVWNDDPVRKHGDVLGVLAMAIATARHG